MEQSLPAIGAIDRRRLVKIFRNRFERREIHDQEERRADPDIDQNHRNPRPEVIAEPRDGVGADRGEQPIERAVGRLEQPPPAERRQGRRDHPRHQHHAAPFALSLGRDGVDRMRRDQADQHLEQHRDQREHHRLANHHPEGVALEQKEEIIEANEFGLGLVEHGEEHRIGRRVGDEAEHQRQQRHAHQHPHGRLAADKFAPPADRLGPGRRRE